MYEMTRYTSGPATVSHCGRTYPSTTVVLKLFITYYVILVHADSSSNIEFVERVSMIFVLVIYSRNSLNDHLS